MERRELIYPLPYIEKGKPNVKDIRINFTSTGARKEYYEIEVEVETARSLWGAHQLKRAEIAAAKLNKEPTDALITELADIEEQIKKIGSADFFTRRFNLIHRILADNGVKEGDKLLTREFWENQVDVDTIMDFLPAAIDKDVEKGIKKNQLLN